MGNQQGKHRGPYGRYIDWENADRPSPPGKPYLAPDSADLPDIIKIKWAKPMTDGGAPIIGYLVEHRRTGSPHWLRASPNLAPDTELVLTGLEPGWRYQFRVTAENDIGRSDPGDLSEPLTVLLQRSAASAPHFNIELADIIALENETVELTVHVLATPAPKIAWYKDGFELFSSRRTKIITENETSTLIIYQAALEDEGEIKCTATNRAGHAVTKGTLRLEAPPRIRLPRQYEEGLIFEQGEVIRLKVTTAGRPPPQVEWYHDGIQIESTGRHEIQDTELGSSLRIRNACREDRGEYFIHGFNKIGEDYVSFLVTITDRPSPPGKPDVVLSEGRTATLTWTDPKDDGGCKVGSFIVEYFRLGWDMWLKAATSRLLTAQLSDLIEGSQYKFRVKAENPYGVSEPSPESEIVFIPDTKRGILKPEPTSAQDWLIPVEEETKKRSVEEPQDSEAVKRRRMLEEKAKRLLDSAPVIESSMGKDAEASVKRRLLEENARKLLDTPLDVLLAEGTPKLSVIEKPPRRKRSPSKSPIIFEAQSDDVPPVPKRRSKAKTTDSVLQASSPSPTRQIPLSPMSPAMLQEDSLTHGSSELMLVLYPEEGKPKGALSAQHRSEIELSLLEPAIAPPLSLSAPELGSDEPFEMPLLRNAISSSELLHERAMARLYQDAEEEEMAKAQMRKKSLERRSSFRETNLERRHSGREVLLERKHSLKEEGSKIPRRKLEEPPKRVETSEEREQLEFAKIRDRLRLKNESEKEIVVRARPANVKQESSMSSQISSFDGETGSEHYDAEVEDVSYEDEEMLEEEELGEEEEDYLEEEESVEEPVKVKKEEKPPVPQHAVPKAIAPKATEEDTYHPRSMIPTRSILKAAPAIEEEPEEPKLEEPKSQEPKLDLRQDPKIQEPKLAIKQKLKIEEPTSEPELPTITLNEEPENINEPPPVSLIPVSTKTKKKSKLLDKIGFGRKKKPAVASLIADSVIPVASVVLPKPILKKKGGIPRRKEKSKEKAEESPSPPRVDEKKKQVRIAEPASSLPVPVSDDPKLSPLTKARQQRLQRRQQSLEEEEEANRVLIYHYSDIVKEFSQPRKPPPKQYLDLKELEAHADVPEIPNLAEEANSDLGERESLLDEEATPEVGSGLTEGEPEVGSGSAEDEPEGVEPPEPEPDVLQRTPSPTPSRTSHSSSPEEAVRSTMDYLTDVAIFLFACWLYVFKSEIYVIPVLFLLVYRQLRDTVKSKYQTAKTSIAGKIPQSLKKKMLSEKADEAEKED